jgi:hypothetical protein
MFSDSRDAAIIISRVYQQNEEDREWPAQVRKLKYLNVAETYRKTWDMIHDIVRSSNAMVCCEEALEPLKLSITNIAPNIMKERKERETLLTDYNSYSRRLKALEQKRDTYEVLRSLSQS